MNKREQIVRWGILVFLMLELVLCVFVLSGNHYGFSFPSEVPVREVQAGQPMLSQSGNWYYMDGGENPENGTVWTTVRDRAESWKTASGPFTSTVKAGENTGTSVVAYTADGSPATCFFRQEFRLEALDQLSALAGEIQYSGAVLVYLNGDIIFAGNVPPGGYRSNLEPGCATESPQLWEERFLVTDLSALQAGVNVLAVELHPPGTGAAYFDMPYLEFIAGEREEAAPRPQKICLEVGETEERLYLNVWMEEAVSLEAGYGTVTDLQRMQENVADEYVSSARADYVLMGRTYDEKRKNYRYRVPLSRLRKGELYQYWIRYVGGEEISEIWEFDLPADLRYSFAVFGPNCSGRNASKAMEIAVAYAENLRFFAAEQGVTDGMGKAGFSNIPCCFLDKPAGYSFAYQDVLFLVLDSVDASPKRWESFIQKKKECTKRRWTVVLIRETGFTVKEDFYSALGVDLTVNAADQDILLVQVSGSELEVKKTVLGP